MRTALMLILLSLLFSCKESVFTREILGDEKKIVEYKNSFLTDKDINSVLPQADISPEDSTEIIDAYIEKWLKKQMIVNKAHQNIDKNTLQEIENQILEYRQDLIINAYNNFLIEKNIKDSISDQEAERYYEDYKDSFPLGEDVVQYRFVTLSKKDQEQGSKLFRSGKDSDFDELMKMVLSSDLPYNDDDSLWYGLNQLPAQVPLLGEGDNLKTLKNRRIIELSDDNFVYLVRILKIEPQGSKSPFNYVKPMIKNLLLNKRKLNLLSDLEEELYKEAVNNNEIKKHEIK